MVMPYEAVEVLDLNPIVHLTRSQGVRHVSPFVLVSNTWIVSEPSLLLRVFLGNPQQKYCIIKLHISQPPLSFSG